MELLAHIHVFCKRFSTAIHVQYNSNISTLLMGVITAVTGITSSKGIVVVYCVSQAPGGMGNGDGSVAHRKQLVQAARLKAGRHEDDVAAGDHAVRHRNVKADPAPAIHKVHQDQI